MAVSVYIEASDYLSVRRQASRERTPITKLMLRYVDPQLQRLREGGFPDVTRVPPVSGKNVSLTITNTDRVLLYSYAKRCDMSAANLLLGWIQPLLRHED